MSNGTNATAATDASRAADALRSTLRNPTNTAVATSSENRNCRCRTYSTTPSTPTSSRQTHTKGETSRAACCATVVSSTNGLAPWANRHGNAT